MTGQEAQNLYIAIIMLWALLKITWIYWVPALLIVVIFFILFTLWLKRRNKK